MKIGIGLPGAIPGVKGDFIMLKVKRNPEIHEESMKTNNKSLKD